MTTGFHSRVFYTYPHDPAGIEFDLPDDAVVSLVILDETGNEIKTVINQQPYKAGTHQCAFLPAGVSEGKFFYRLSADIDGAVRDPARIRNFVDVKRL